MELLELREGDDWRVDVEPNDRVDDEELEPWLPNERLLLLLLGMNVRLGFESGFAVKRLLNGRESFLGCDTVVRVLLWRGVPKERLPLVGCLSSLTCVPNWRLRRGLSFRAPLFRFPNVRLPILPLLRLLSPGLALWFCGPPVQVRLLGS